jgi:hypothetical protein
MRREAVAQLARVRGQIDAHLLELSGKHTGRGLVAAELPAYETVALARAAHDGPQQQVGHVDGNGLRQAREFSCVVADEAGVAFGFEREDFEGADFLSWVLAKVASIQEDRQDQAVLCH